MGQSKDEKEKEAGGEGRSKLHMQHAQFFSCGFLLKLTIRSKKNVLMLDSFIRRKK